jgi:hypothetical protein
MNRQNPAGGWKSAMTFDAFPRGRILEDFNRAVQYIHYAFHVEIIVYSAIHFRDFSMPPLCSVRDRLLDLPNLSIRDRLASSCRPVGAAQQPDLPTGLQ